MIKEAASVLIFLGVSIVLPTIAQFKCADGTWAPCEPKPPVLCIAYSTKDQTDCIERVPRPLADVETMRYEANKKRWDIYSSHREAGRSR